VEPGSEHHLTWLQPLEDFYSGSPTDIPAMLRQVEQMREHGWSEADWENTSRFLRDRMWEAVQIQRRVENDAAELARMQAEMG
jgi:hypothetical protein